MTRFSLIVAVATGLLATGAVAETKASPGDLGYAAIEAGNWSIAESQLKAGLKDNPNDPMRMVNLAFVLQQQGKSDEAAALYRQVLSMDSNPKVAVGSDDRIRGVRVKSIANKGIASIEGQ